MINDLILISVYVLTTCFLTLVFVKSFIIIANKFGFKSVPHVGGVRQDIVITSGGIAFGCAYLVMILIFHYFQGLPQQIVTSLVLGSGIMMIVGFLDDIYSLSSITRLLVQFAFVAFLLWNFDATTFSYGNPVIMIPIYFFGLTWLINTFNFIDGADGLVSTNSLIFSLTGGIFCFSSGNTSVAIVLWMLSAVNISFLYFNWSPAKVFMGDSGSLMIGSIYSIIIVNSLYSEISTIWAWLILLSIFYVETTITLIVRLIRRENVFKSHHSLHAYQQLIIRTGKHNKPAIFSIIISMIWTIPMSILSYNFPNYGFYITLITCIPLSILFYLYGPKLAKEN